jgi:hypothetical protein
VKMIPLLSSWIPLLASGNYYTIARGDESDQKEVRIVC